MDLEPFLGTYTITARLEGIIVNQRTFFDAVAAEILHHTCKFVTFESAKFEFRIASADGVKYSSKHTFQNGISIKFTLPSHEGTITISVFDAVFIVVGCKSIDTGIDAIRSMIAFILERSVSGPVHKRVFAQVIDR